MDSSIIGPESLRTTFARLSLSMITTMIKPFGHKYVCAIYNLLKMSDVEYISFGIVKYICVNIQQSSINYLHNTDIIDYYNPSVGIAP